MRKNQGEGLLGIMAANLILETPAQMLKLFRKLLGKSEAPAAGPRVVATAVPQAIRPAPRKADPEPVQPMPQVEVTQLSLAAILNRFPDDLKSVVGNIPDPSVTVALPLSTIQKQLPTGSVKMSLASLFRQAPAGTFTQARLEDRRMVEVPLSEIFRHVNPGLLARREQRRLDLPEDAVGLFSDGSNPYAMAPGVSADNGRAAVSQPTPQRSVAPPMDGQSRTTRQPEPARVVAPPAGFTAPSTPVLKTSAPAPEGPPLEVRIVDLAGGWPEPIRSEALAMEDAMVALPASAVTSGLARGKVMFTWAQLRSWLKPEPSAPSEGSDATELLLPLKVVAPAFLAHSRPKNNRKSVAIDDSIPALFNGNTPEVAPPPAPEPPAQTADVEEAPSEPALPAIPSIPLAASVPSVIAPPLSLAPPAPEPAHEQEKPVETAEPASAPEPLPAQAAVDSAHAPQLTIAPPPTETIPLPGSRQKQTLGEIFGSPEKTNWSPPELVKATVELPGVAGAVVALQEGLLVSAHLPEEMKGDTVAAFLPQIFARLSNYAGEMKLGAVEDVLFTSNGAHFKIFRLGEVYFAILGKPGESLPWDSLRCIAEELGQNHQK